MLRSLLILLAVQGAAGCRDAPAQGVDHCVDYTYFHQEGGYLDDGIIDRAEFAEIAEVWFVEWDLDQSGYVGAPEYSACYDAIGWEAGESYTAMDLDGDGVLGEDEFFNTQVFDARDRNGDGEIAAPGEWF